MCQYEVMHVAAIGLGKRGSADVRICRLGLGLVCHIRTLQIRTFAFDPLLHVVVVIFLSGVRLARF